MADETIAPEHPKTTPKKRLIVINGSDNRNGLTHQCLLSVAHKLAHDHHLEIEYFFLQSEPPSAQFTQYHQLLGLIVDGQTGRILIGSPTYFGGATPKLINFFSFLRKTWLKNGKGGDAFRNRIVHLHSNGFSSGTDLTIAFMQRACEALGFTIEGFGTTEYNLLWKDNRIRYGLRSDEACAIDVSLSVDD